MIPVLQGCAVTVCQKAKMKAFDPDVDGEILESGNYFNVLGNKG
jgi:hypothetical protein